MTTESDLANLRQQLENDFDEHCYTFFDSANEIERDPNHNAAELHDLRLIGLQQLVELTKQDLMSCLGIVGEHYNEFAALHPGHTATLVQLSRQEQQNSGDLMDCMHWSRVLHRHKAYLTQTQSQAELEAITTELVHVRMDTISALLDISYDCHDGLGVIKHLDDMHTLAERHPQNEKLQGTYAHLASYAYGALLYHVDYDTELEKIRTSRAAQVMTTICDLAAAFPDNDTIQTALATARKYAEGPPIADLT